MQGSSRAAFIGAVGLDWQIMGVGNFSSMPGEADIIMRNTTTGGMLVYDIANNQITNVAFLGMIGLDWQFSGISSVQGPSRVRSRVAQRQHGPIRSLQHRQ